MQRLCRYCFGLRRRSFVQHYISRHTPFGRTTGYNYTLDIITTKPKVLKSEDFIIANDVALETQN